MTYGPPQRFKAVITKDNNENREGECSNPFDLDSDVRGNELASPLRREIWWEKRLPKAVIYQLYQSTGHHDANGKEIFFGDVLFKPWPIPTFFRVELRFDQIRLVQWARYDENMVLIGGAHSEYNIKGSAHLTYCIGNIHHSPEQLQAAAEKVRAERGLL